MQVYTRCPVAHLLRDWPHPRTHVSSAAQNDGAALNVNLFHKQIVNY